VLQIQSLRYAWPGAATDCLSIPSLELKAGSKVFLHGPSGCGKSTLLGLMAGVLVAREGQVVLLGQDWATLPRAAPATRGVPITWAWSSSSSTCCPT
jgi:putative ABC transport system ATP-binding protein